MIVMTLRLNSSFVGSTHTPLLSIFFISYTERGDSAPGSHPPPPAIWIWNSHCLYIRQILLKLDHRVGRKFECNLLTLNFPPRKSLSFFSPSSEIWTPSLKTVIERGRRSVGKCEEIFYVYSNFIPNRRRCGRFLPHILSIFVRTKCEG